VIPWSRLVRTSSDRYGRLASWHALLDEARRGAPLAGDPMHGELHWRAVAWAGLRIRDVAPELSAAVLVAFGLLHDCRRVDDGWDRDHGARAADLAARSRSLLHLLGPGGRDLVEEACRLHEDGLTRPERPTVGACWDADRVNLVRLGFQLDPSRFTVLSQADGSLEAVAEEARQMVRTPPSWQSLFEAVAPAA
jgi:uncharacterized protein